MLSRDEYLKAYSEGYMAGIEKERADAKAAEKPYFTIDDIAERYRVGRGKAGEILRAVRHMCNGGGFGSCSMVKRSELLYWESIVDKQYVERLPIGGLK